MRINVINKIGFDAHLIPMNDGFQKRLRKHVLRLLLFLLPKLMPSLTWRFALSELHEGTCGFYAGIVNIKNAKLNHLLLLMLNINFAIRSFIITAKIIVLPVARLYP